MSKSSVLIRVVDLFLFDMSFKGNMGTPVFQEFKKQASFFLREKIKTARLALTDVTPTQLMAEEATNGNPGGPDTRVLKMISRAAFEVDDYWRIVDILHRRLGTFEKRNWRAAYKALIVLEHLLCHGPESVAEEFQTEKDVIDKMSAFQHIDEKGFNWGLSVRRKAERVMKLLENRTLLREERNRAREVTRGIQGFGSFNHRTGSDQVLQESSTKQYDRRCNSQFNEHGNQEAIPDADSEKKLEKPASTRIVSGYRMEEDIQNTHPVESNPLLSVANLDSMARVISREEEEGHHPFSESSHVTAVSLLSAPERPLEAAEV